MNGEAHQVFTTLQNVNFGADSNFQTNVLNLLTTMTEQTRKLSEENAEMKEMIKTIMEQNNNILEENKKFKEENRKIIKHFTEEFIALKMFTNKSMTELKREKTLTSTLPQLPLSEVDDLLRFDQDVKEDEEKKTELVWIFNKQTCDDVGKFISDCLKRIFKDDLIASQFSWTNANDNVPVKDLTFIKILKDLAIDKIPQTSTTMVENQIKKFFNLSKDRLYKSKKKEESKIKSLSAEK